MITLLDFGGPIETARYCDNVAVMDERKIDQVINELDTRLVWLLYRKLGGLVKVLTR